MLRDTLAVPVPAEMPSGSATGVDEVVVGRRQDGSPWALPLRGRHTLVVGCSGAGKGSILWGIAAGLGPAVSADVVRLWGIDLKRGVELGIGQGLFHATAYTPAAAMAVLARAADGDRRARRASWWAAPGCTNRRRGTRCMCW